MTTFEEVNKHTVPETEESIKAEMDSVRKSLANISKAQKTREEEELGGGHEVESIGDDSVVNVQDPNRKMLH